MLFLASCQNGIDPETAAQLELGRSVFNEVSQPTCATCHALQAVQATGQIGPDLDALKPDHQRIVTAVTNGVGLMPGQREVLTPEQIEAVAAFIVEVTGTP